MPSLWSVGGRVQVFTCARQVLYQRKQISILKCLPFFYQGFWILSPAVEVTSSCYVSTNEILIQFLCINTSLLLLITIICSNEVCTPKVLFSVLFDYSTEFGVWRHLLLSIVGWLYPVFILRCARLACEWRPRAPDWMNGDVQREAAFVYPSQPRYASLSIPPILDVLREAALAYPSQSRYTPLSIPPILAVTLADVLWPPAHLHICTCYLWNTEPLFELRLF